MSGPPKRKLIFDDKQPNIALVPLANTQFQAVIEREDAELVGQYNWCLMKGRLTWYARTSVTEDGKSRCILLHRLVGDADGLPASVQVDHRDGDGLNCRRANLRQAGNGQNLSNRGKQRNNSSGFKGVYKKPRGRWKASIQVGYRQVHVGYFDTAEEAARAYDAAALKHHGEFALLNFPA